MKLSSTTKARSAAALVCVVVSISSSIVLWQRQTHDALLRANSVPAGFADVVFWMAPTFLVYVAIARTPLRVAIFGVAIAGLATAMWWSVATDRHSTASLGPGLLFWFALPAAMAITALAASASTAPSSRSSSGVRVAAVVVSLLAGVLGGPPILMLVAIGWGIWYLRRARTPRRAPGSEQDALVPQREHVDRARDGDV